MENECPDFYRDLWTPAPFKNMLPPLSDVLSRNNGAPLSLSVQHQDNKRSPEGWDSITHNTEQDPLKKKSRQNVHPIISDPRNSQPICIAETEVVTFGAWQSLLIAAFIYVYLSAVFIASTRRLAMASLLDIKFLFQNEFPTYFVFLYYMNTPHFRK